MVDLVAAALAVPVALALALALVVVLARQDLGAEGDPTNALIALVVITIVIAAATLVIYRRAA
jgi:hypothetical protein